jgi:hypothetical protein
MVLLNNFGIIIADFLVFKNVYSHLPSRFTGHARIMDPQYGICVMLTWFLEFRGGPRFLENLCTPPPPQKKKNTHFKLRFEDGILTRMCGLERLDRIIE